MIKVQLCLPCVMADDVDVIVLEQHYISCGMCTFLSELKNSNTTQPWHLALCPQFLVGVKPPTYVPNTNADLSGLKKARL